MGFTWLVSISSASFIVNWLIISITNWRFHQALKAQNDSLFKEMYAWRSPLGFFPSIWLFMISIFLMACLVAISIRPVVGPPASPPPISLQPYPALLFPIPLPHTSANEAGLNTFLHNKLLPKPHWPPRHRHLHSKLQARIPHALARSQDCGLYDGPACLVCGGDSGFG